MTLDVKGDPSGDADLGEGKAVPYFEKSFYPFGRNAVKGPGTTFSVKKNIRTRGKGKAHDGSQVRTSGFFG